MIKFCMYMSNLDNQDKHFHNQEKFQFPFLFILFTVINKETNDYLSMVCIMTKLFICTNVNELRCMILLTHNAPSYNQIKFYIRSIIIQIHLRLDQVLLQLAHKQQVVLNHHGSIYLESGLVVLLSLVYFVSICEM